MLRGEGPSKRPLAQFPSQQQSIPSFIPENTQAHAQRHEEVHTCTVILLVGTEVVTAVTPLLTRITAKHYMRGVVTAVTPLLTRSTAKHYMRGGDSRHFAAWCWNCRPLAALRTRGCGSRRSTDATTTSVAPSTLR